jgi:hypothetical protein
MRPCQCGKSLRLAIAPRKIPLHARVRTASSVRWIGFSGRLACCVGRTFEGSLLLVLLTDGTLGSIFPSMSTTYHQNPERGSLVTIRPLVGPVWQARYFGETDSTVIVRTLDGRAQEIDRSLVLVIGSPSDCGWNLR